MGDLNRAAAFFNATILNVLDSSRGVHAETAIATAGRMAGSMLLLSILPASARLTPGSPVFTDRANVEGPALIGLMYTRLGDLGNRIDERAIATSTIGVDRAQLSLLETQARFDGYYRTYCEEQRLSFHEAASASAMAAGMLIHACRSVLDVNDGAALALCGIVEGAKTAPRSMPLRAAFEPPPRPPAPAAARRWYNLR